GIGAGGVVLAAVALGVVPDRQVARDEIHLLPVIVDEGRGRVDARLEAEEAGAAAVLRPLVERAGEDLLLDPPRISFRRLPAARHVEAVEFEMRLHRVHRLLLCAGPKPSDTTTPRRARGKPEMDA